MKLHELRDIEGARKRRKRVGRGPGSGMGKLAGRGMKGQKSRSGTALGTFEGGQMPLYMRLPKRGFNNINRKRLPIVNLGQIQQFIDAGRLDSSQPIDESKLVACGLVRRLCDGVRVLADGSLKCAINLQVTGVSSSASKAIESAGGSVTITQSKDLVQAKQD